ncbi:MAG: HIT domain-containing protein [Deltaproteobacteria bacterium]|nr:MAG: HIT domain-containing protein [Deltaproteobacteria bacterium]
MERLWAPWRLEYVQAARTVDCIFCLGDEAGDEGRLVLLRGRHCFIIMNRFPYSNGHLMVAPLRHVADPGLLTAGEADELHRMTVYCRDILRATCRAQGFNIGMNLGEVAGAGIIDHLHQHIVPRWAGDTNFMPVFADVRVIPQHLEATCRQLREAMAAHPGNFR